MEDKDQLIQENTRRYMELLLDAGCPMEYVAQEGHKVTLLQYEDTEKAALMWKAAQILTRCSRDMGMNRAAQMKQG